MLPYKSMAIVLTTLACGWLIHSSTASAIRSDHVYQDQVTEQETPNPDDDQDHVYNRDQRNGGTQDVLHNIPDLGDIGK